MGLAGLKNKKMTEQILYGTKVNQPAYMEEIISTKPENFKDAVVWAKSNGFDRLRVASINLSIKPDFTGVVSKKVFKQK